jgi:hypothetical protein
MTGCTQKLLMVQAEQLAQMLEINYSPNCAYFTKYLSTLRVKFVDNTNAIRGYASLYE